MKKILLFLLFCLVLSNCASSSPPQTLQEIQAKKQENLNEYRNIVNQRFGYNYCADKGKFFYYTKADKMANSAEWVTCQNEPNYDTLVESVYTGMFGDMKPRFLDSCIEMGFFSLGEFIIYNPDGSKTRDYAGYKTACKLAGPTRLYDERKIEISKLSDEFLCIKQQQSKDLMFDEEVKERQLSSQCYEIFADYQFAIKVDSQKKNCKKIGYEENTPAMADCIKEFILNETNNTNTSTTVVVEGSSSGSSDAVAEELRKMNKRQSIEYYNKMMKTGYDMMTCYTWPNC
tara:strand:- start:210 stop:1073 length:864 start_codon:yes stop_codon:yes gene_type:complete